MADGSIAPEEFGKIFQSEAFETIYRCTSKDFQELISLEDFIELATSFNSGVKGYQLEFSSFLQDAECYIWLDDRKEKGMAVSFDRHRVIQSLLLKPWITYPESDRHFTQHTYKMPIKGEWFVFWGGANEFINYHYLYESQRYAYDLVKMEGGSTYQDTPDRNENYYCFNEEIVAPADGKVMKVLDGMKDHIPGEMDEDHPAGNYIIMEHMEKEYSLFAHLKRDSIQVQAGDCVKEGQLIGRCGNSGNSSEPHVHFQVSDTADFERGKSIRIRFKDGKEPIQGDTVG